MIKIVKAENFSIKELRQRNAQTTAEVTQQVSETIEKVRTEGDRALMEFAERFDGIVPTAFKVSQEEIDRAVQQISPELLEAMKSSLANIRHFHKRQLQEGFIDAQAGRVMGQRVIPLEKVGIYVPGGTAAYPSTVLMNAVPAKLAGVEQIIMVTPLNQKGGIAPAILAAAKLAGVSAVYQIGGAQAIAALAYGTETIPKVDKVVGPGNIYVATAKKLVYGTTAIDMIAGPSDVLIVADEKAQGKWLAADLLAQAEHDENAQAILVTISKKLADETQREVQKQLQALPRQAIAAASIENNGRIILVDSLEEAIELANLIAPEHLELAVNEPFIWLGRVKNAGSVFLGYHTPEVLGDYFAGPNHTLPTEGTARFYSPLSVDDFVKRSSYLYYSAEELAKATDKVAVFAESEGLAGHARSILVRKEKKQ